MTKQETQFADRIQKTLAEPLPLEEPAPHHRPDGAGGRQRIDRRGRRFLGRADGRVFDGMLGSGHVGALVAGRGGRGHDHRPQGDDPGGPRAGGHGIGPVSIARLARRPPGPSSGGASPGTRTSRCSGPDQKPPFDYRDTPGQRPRDAQEHPGRCPGLEC